jgi:aminoglycoside/choline kinase family phosphotransferase
MKPEQAELFLIEELCSKSMDEGHIEKEAITEVDKLTGDASTRRYYRIFTESNSYVVCLDNPTKESGNSPFVDVQEYLNCHDIRVPLIHDKNLQKGYILEEDLGDKTLLQGLSQLSSVDEEKKVYIRVIDELLKIHKIPEADIKKTPMGKIAFDYEKLKYEIDFTIKYFMKHFLKVGSEDELKKLSKEFDPICERLSKEKMVLTHRDFHSRNIMLKKNDLIVIDFQDARFGIPQYDLVSLLEDCYYKVNGENKVHLIKYYWDNLPLEIHGQQDFDTFMRLYCDMAIQRVFKALGSFAYIFHTREDERYLKYIGFGMEKLRTTFLKHDRYDSLRKSLFKIYYES